MYPMTRVDASGATLDGSKHHYTLTFPAGQLPPVNAFWSVTMYDGKSQLLIENPIGRYLINSPMLSDMKKNRTARSPSTSRRTRRARPKEANWLAGAQRHHLPGHAPLLAEDRSPLYSPRRRRQLASTGSRAGKLSRLPTSANP
jgi:hypothetical protein